jgi:hypothetical protein
MTPPAGRVLGFSVLVVVLCCVKLATCIPMQTSDLTAIRAWRACVSLLSTPSQENAKILVLLFLVLCEIEPVPGCRCIGRINIWIYPNNVRLVRESQFCFRCSCVFCRLNSNIESVKIFTDLSWLLSFSPALESIGVSKCGIFGTIPSAIFTLYPNLTDIGLSQNNLTGTIPTTVGQTQKMFDLYVGSLRSVPIRGDVLKCNMLV